WPQPYGGGSFDVPLTTGLHGMLYSPGKGFFWYNPFLLLGVVGVGLLWTRERALAVLLTFLVVGRLLFYARWTFWAGDATWGPRFLLPACVPLAVGTAVALDRLAARTSSWPRRAGGAAVAALALAGLIVNVASVASPYWLWWDVINQPRRPGAVVAQQIADSYWTWDLSGLRYSFELLGDGPSQLAHFAGGPDAIAVLGLATGAVCLALALARATTKGSS
ncbi:MAG TPA: hypothetical protein VHN78_02955, partial [Chloroflexota bacterium]|nr:hypothetical protein [Chloroflexota bacterium]